MYLIIKKPTIDQPANMMLSEKLKEATKTAHQLVETKLTGSIKAIATKQQYATLLSSFYSYFAALENAMNGQVDLSLLPDYHQRRKAGSLADDLMQLEAELPALATKADIPPINNHLQALGAMYVMEGSTLGGKIISKMICRQLSLRDRCGTTFFNGYGEQTSRMWQTFKDLINQPLQPHEEAVVIESAHATFLQLGHWFSRHLS